MPFQGKVGSATRDPQPRNSLPGLPAGARRNPALVSSEVSPYRLQGGLLFGKAAGKPWRCGHPPSSLPLPAGRSLRNLPRKAGGGGGKKKHEQEKDGEEERGSAREPLPDTPPPPSQVDILAPNGAPSERGFGTEAKRLKALTGLAWVWRRERRGRASPGGGR